MEEKEKKDNMVMNVSKISQKMKTKSLLSTEKKVQNQKKCFILNIRKYFNSENFAFL